MISTVLPIVVTPTVGGPSSSSDGDNDGKTVLICVVQVDVFIVKLIA